MPGIIRQSTLIPPSNQLHQRFVTLQPGYSVQLMLLTFPILDELHTWSLGSLWHLLISSALRILGIS
jgi:hypothetical protein